MGRLRISAAFMQTSPSSHCSICSWCPANRVRLRGVERLLYLLKLLADHPDLADDGAVDQHLTAYDLDCNRLTVQCLGARELDNIGGFHISGRNMISKNSY